MKIEKFRFVIVVRFYFIIGVLLVGFFVVLGVFGVYGLKSVLIV